jgi:hypothetical protein
MTRELLPGREEVAGRGRRWDEMFRSKPWKGHSETTLLQLIGGLSIAVHKVEPVALVCDPLLR